MRLIAYLVLSWYSALCNLKGIISIKMVRS